MLLYDSSVSGNCYKVRLLFAQLGIEYQRRELSVFDRSDRGRVLGELNPAMRVPTLVLADGRTLAESGAILFHFARGTDLWPADAFHQAQVLQWMFFEQYDIEPNVAVLRFWRMAGHQAAEEELAVRRQAGERALAALDRHLAAHEFLVGQGYSIADIALYAYSHVAPEGGFSLEPHQALRAWLARVASQPGHVPIDA